MPDRTAERDYGGPEVLDERMNRENEVLRSMGKAEFPNVDAYQEFLEGHPPSDEWPTIEELRAAAAALGDPRERLRELHRRVPRGGWRSRFMILD